MSNLSNELNRNTDEFENYLMTCDQNKETSDGYKKAYDEQTSLTQKLHSSVSAL